MKKPTPGETAQFDQMEAHAETIAEKLITTASGVMALKHVGREREAHNLSNALAATLYRMPHGDLAAMAAFLIRDVVGSRLERDFSGDVDQHAQSILRAYDAARFIAGDAAAWLDEDPDGDVDD